MRYFALLVLLVCSVAVVRAEGGKARVVCFGDSITKRGYPAELGKLLEVEVVNAGVAGNNTLKGVRRMEHDAMSKNPDVVVIFFGTNDMRVDAEKVYVPVEKYERNLETMLEICEHADVKAVLCTLPPIDAEAYFERHEKEVFDKAGGLEKLMASYRAAALRVGKKEKVPVVDLNQLLIKEEWMHPDGVHPSTGGCRIIARLIAEEVRPLVKKAKER